MNALLEDLVPGVEVAGIESDGAVSVVSVVAHGTRAVTLTYRTRAGAVHERLLFREDEGTFEIVEGESEEWRFDGDARLFRLAAEARRIRMAHLFDPYLALNSSAVRPLPHQIEAVYGDMLPRLPLRFLLADDPGSGKTVMAGLYLKELMIRGDVERCLVVAPGPLTVQWQDEMREKFGLRFDLITKHDLDGVGTVNVFEEKRLLIARLDQLARRREELEPVLRRAEWDLVVVDEAHRMAAHFSSDERIRRTRRFELGEVLRDTTRHLLLMTATPHNGSEEDFQLFLSLLDVDRFAGRFRDGVHAIDPSDLMRRMVKERLRKFDGKPLFPERRSYSVAYRLSEPEMKLYNAVTKYVQDQMNAADRLRQAGDRRRGNAVGFALTILQRRLASSPEAIHQSLRRRRARLQERVEQEKKAARGDLTFTARQERLAREVQVDAAELPDDLRWSSAGLLGDIDLDAYDEMDSEQQDEFDAEVVDAATAAATVTELEGEIATLEGLERLAFDLRNSGQDRKWQQLSDTLSESVEMFTPVGDRRKLIVFTEHRDTLNYLVARLRTFLGDQAAVVSISGRTRRDDRREIQERFRQDPKVLVLVATDAAGEGINLQQAHLVVNYDLPWNPNRIEQRFGRVHRIGQTEVCHMWNLVARGTREAQVYERLLIKINQMRRTFDGQVYDVLGEALSGRELKQLLLDAIRYGDRPDVRRRLDEVIERDMPARVAAAIEEPVLATENLDFADVERIRREMDEAALRRLQPHYVQSFFEAAFGDVGGRLRQREDGRFEVRWVPPVLRRRDTPTGGGGRVLERYARVTFDKSLAEMHGAPVAELLAPGHPLLDTVVNHTLERHGHQLARGTVLVDDADDGTTPRLMVILEHEVADARPTATQPHTVVSRRFEFVEIPRGGSPVAGGHAPYLDYRPPTDEERRIAEPHWFGGVQLDEFRQIALTHAIETAIPDHLAGVRLRTGPRVDAVREAVHERLSREINHWDNRVIALREAAADGRTPAMNVDQAQRRAEEFANRLNRRTEDLDRQRTLRALPPRIAGAALVLPAGMLHRLAGNDPARAALNRHEVEQRAVEAVLRAEEAAGRHAVDLNAESPNHPGYDVHSTTRTGDVAEYRYIEVKGRLVGSDTVTVSRNQILAGLNEPDHWILALVEVHPEGRDVVRYVDEPFAGLREDLVFDVTSVNYEWDALWARGRAPAEHKTGEQRGLTP